MRNGEWRVGSGEWGENARLPAPFPTPHSLLPTPPLLRDAELPEDKGVIERHVAQAVVAPRCAAVAARLQLDLEQKQIVVGLHLTQFGDIFGRLPVHHL